MGGGDGGREEEWWWRQGVNLGGEEEEGDPRGLSVASPLSTEMNCTATNSP